LAGTKKQSDSVIQLIFHKRGARADDARTLFLSSMAEERVEALDAVIPFHRPFREPARRWQRSNRENISSTPLHISGLRPVSTPLAQSSRVYFGGFAPDFPHYISGKEFKKMKTFIVYDLDSQMPVAVGEQVSAQTARYCASVATGIFQANLLAEEIDLEKQVIH